MKDKFEKLHKYLADIRPARQAAKDAIARQQAWLDKYSKYEGDWKYEIDNARNMIARLQEQERAHNEEVYERLLEMGRELIVAAAEKSNQPLDLNDDRLQKALTLANIGNLDYQTASGLAEQFRGNQTALRMLNRTFTEKGIHSGIDALIYDPEGLEQSLNDHIYHLAWQNGTPETFQGFLGKFAHFEGVDLPAVDMTAVTVEAVRKAAGLAPEPKPKEKAPVS